MTLHEFDITFFTVVGWPQLPYIHGLVVSAAGSNRRSASLIPGRADYQFVNSSEVVKLLFKANDGRGRRPDWTILGATYASANTWSGRGVSHHSAYIGNCY